MAGKIVTSKGIKTKKIRTKEIKKKYNPKIFVLDTNVILHDFNAIYNFQENDLYIPITVLEELDKFKKGDDTLNYNAREFIRNIDKLSSNGSIENGASLGKGRGFIKVELGHPFPSQMIESLADDIPDHRIISTAIWLRDNNPGKKVVLITKDMNMRLKAKALGVMVQDYLNDKVDDEKLEHTKREVCIKKIPSSVLDSISSSGTATLKELSIRRAPASNQLYKFNDKEGNTFLGRYDSFSKSIVEVRNQSAFGISPRNQEQVFALDAVMNPDIKLISLTGTAGTGKTLIALAGALAQSDNFDQILLSRPVIPLQNQDLGYLPGSVNEKIGPYMLPLFDNLAVIKKAFKPSSKEVVKIEDMLRREKLLINPLAYIRGRSLTNVFFIIDEAQNLTPHEIKTIITRAGDGTKIVFTGDIFQIDQPYLDINSNGLTHLGDKFFGQSVFEHVNLIKGERSLLSELAGKLL